MNLEEAKNIISKHKRMTSLQKKLNAHMVGMAIISFFCILTSIGTAKVFGFYISEVSVSIFAIVVLIYLIHTIMIFVWRSERPILEASLLAMYDDKALTEEEIYDMIIVKNKHEQRVSDWYDDLSPEEKIIADSYANKKFIDIMKKL